MIDTVFSNPVFLLILCELFMMLAFAGVYERDLSKEKYVIAVSIIVLVLIVEVLDYYFVDFDTASTALEPIMCFAAAFVFGIFILKIPVKQALYCNIWAYLLTETTSQVLLPVLDSICRYLPSVFNTIIHVLGYGVGIGIMFLGVKKYLLRELEADHHYHVGRQKLLLCVFVAVMYFWITNYQFIFWLLGEEPETGSTMITFFRLIASIACEFLLYAQDSIEKRQRSEQELDMMRQLWYRQQDQYRISQENIDIINRKCHDLKYQVAALRKLSDEKEVEKQLRELEQSVLIYDTAVKTGNPVLDTVLTEKTLYCEKNKINITCMVDGSCLEFIGKVDLYTIFGNALDNAIEAVMKIEEIEKRVIQLSVYREKNLVMIRIRNFCENPPEFRNGLPISTKQDKNYHGFGTKSIRYTAEKYGGGIACQVTGHCYVLQILLPIPG